MESYQEILAREECTFDYILHLSDLHIRLSSRFKEYNIVFQSFVKILSSYDRAIVVITGDIFHTKNELTPDCVMLCVQFLRNLSKHAPVIIIPGNHDLVMHNLEKCDTITSVLHRRSLKRVHYLKASGTYRFGNLLFIHNSLWHPSSSDNDVSPTHAWIHAPSKRPHKDDVMVHLYHGMVGRCESSNGMRFSDTLSLSKFDGADMVLLGDIHKHQHLAPHIAYAGSMISQNFHETDDHHGFLEWCVASKTTTFHPIPNPYCFRHIDVHNQDGNLRLVHLGRSYNNWKTLFEREQMTPKMRVQILLHDEIESVPRVRKICREYGIVQPRIRHVLASTSPSSSSSMDPLVQLGTSTRDMIFTLIPEYLKTQLGITSEDDVRTYMAILQENVDMLGRASAATNVHTKYIGQRWRILDLSFDYLFGYGKDNVIRFDDTTSTSAPHVIGIFGSNSVGKSTLIDILLFMLYGRITRYASGNAIPKELIHENQSSFQATLRIQVGSDIYRIHKHGKRDKNLRIRIHESIHLEESSLKKDVDMTEEHRLKTDRVIRELIGSIEQFLSLSVCLQAGAGSTKSFKEMTQKERKEFMYSILQLDGFEVYRQRLHQDMKELEARCRVLELEQSRETCDSVGAWTSYLHHEQRSLERCQESKRKVEIALKSVHEERRAYDQKRTLLLETQQLLDNETARHTLLQTNIQRAGVNPEEQGSMLEENEDMDMVTARLQEVEKRVEDLNTSILATHSGPCDPPSAPPSFSFREYVHLRKNDFGDNHVPKKSLPSITPCPDDGFVYNYFHTTFIECKALELRELADRHIASVRSAKEQMTNYQKRADHLRIQKEACEKEYESHEKATYDPESCEHCRQNPFRHRQVVLRRQMQKVDHDMTVLQQKYEYQYRDVQKRMDEVNRVVEILYEWNDPSTAFYDEDDEEPCPRFPPMVKYPITSDVLALSLHAIIQDLEHRIQSKESFCHVMDAFIRRHVQMYQEKRRMVYQEYTTYFQSLDKYVLTSHRNRRRAWEIRQRDRLVHEAQRLRQTQQQMLASILLQELDDSQRSLASLRLKLENLEKDVKRMEKGMLHQNNRLEEELTELVTEEATLRHRVADAERRMKEWRARHAEYTSLVAERDRTKTLLRITDRDGFPLYLLRHIVKGLSQYMNEILQHFLDRRRIEFGVDEEGNVVFHTFSEDSNMTFHFYGGMESLMIDLATKITFAHFGLCPMSSFFILDENISVLDEYHIQHIHVLFEFLKQHFETVLMISHIPTIKNMVDRAVLIQKDDDGYSHVDFQLSSH